MPNLNCDVSEDDHQGDHQSDQQGDYQGDEQEIIRKLVIANKGISVKEIANELGVSPETVRRRIKQMPDVTYVGSGYSGYWEIREDRCL